MIEALEKLLAPLYRRVLFMVRQGLVVLADDTQPTQTLRVSLLAGELRSAVRSFQHYGFTSVPDAGAETLIISIGGQGGNLVSIATDDQRYRPLGGLPGEVFIYSKFGQTIHLAADGSIVCTPAPGKKLQVIGDIDLQGNLQATGDIQAGGNIVAVGNVSDSLGPMQEMRTDYNSHTHAVTGATTVTPVPTMV